MPILHPAPAWTSPRDRYVTLWHGCTTQDQKAIAKNGVDPLLGRVDTDFGRGFYTTTIKRQARMWAWARFYDPKFKRSTGNQPVVLRFRVDRHELAKLTCISFVCGDFHHQEFWSLVQHCRQSTIASKTAIVNDHNGPVTYHGEWYDIACGPVAAFWQQRSAMLDADQISFHTDGAAALLNNLILSGNKSDFDFDYIK